ncbi:MAG: type II secretion system protein [Patescibacteria group bacterium]
MKKGFTLIEILIVVAIIGLLTSVVLVGLGSSRAKGRDARRTADLHQTQNALELYYSKNQSYPNVADWSSLRTSLTGAGIGIPDIPSDPIVGWNYGYCRTPDGYGYVVAAYLEDLESAALKQYSSSATFPCEPTATGAPSNPLCSKSGSITNKYCLTF